MAYTNYAPGSHTTTQLVGSVLSSTAGLTVDLASVQLHYGVVLDSSAATANPIERTSLSFYDGSLNLGIGAGLLLTSGNGVVPTTKAVLATVSILQRHLTALTLPTPLLMPNSKAR